MTEPPPRRHRRRERHRTRRAGAETPPGGGGTPGEQPAPAAAMPTDEPPDRPDRPDADAPPGPAERRRFRRRSAADRTAERRGASGVDPATARAADRGAEQPAGRPEAGPGSAGVQAPPEPGGRAKPRPARRPDVERGLRGIVGAGPSQVGALGAMRARDAARPTAEDLATAERDLVIVRRHYVPPDTDPRPT